MPYGLKFIRGLLDPSERDLVDTAHSLSNKFDQLQLHARDFDSMLWHFCVNNDFLRFEKNVTDATMQLRDFKATAEELIKQCAALSLIPPLLADHVRREAEHFLEVLRRIEEASMDCDQPKVIHCDYDCME